MSQSLYVFPEGGGRAMIADLEFGEELIRIPVTEAPQVREMQFGPGGATTADSGLTVTASYTGLDLGAKPTRAMMTFSFTAGALESGAAAIIANPNGLNTIANIVDASLHIVFNENKCNVGYFLGNVLTNVEVPYTRTLTKDGATKYRGGFTLFPDHVDVHLPDGRTVTVTNTAYFDNAGRYVQFESFTQFALGTRATFYAVTFEALS